MIACNQQDFAAWVKTSSSYIATEFHLNLLLKKSEFQRLVGVMTKHSIFNCSKLDSAFAFEVATLLFFVDQAEQ